MIDWAVLFWRWLVSSRILRLLLLDLDGLTCSAIGPLNEEHAPELRIACASVADMALSGVTLGEAGAVQEWGAFSCAHMLQHMGQNSSASKTLIWTVWKPPKPCSCFALS